jgi:signal transduction histidine kinase
MIDRARRRVWIFAIAALVPAAALGFFALRSLRTEESLRRTETEDQVREFLKAAAREIQADLDARLAEVKSKPAPATAPEPEEPPEIAESIRRERPDLLPYLHRATVLEFSSEDPRGARLLYVELSGLVEVASTRARLLAAAARCARKADLRDEARTHYETLIAEYPDVRGETLLPLGASARLHLLALGADRDRIATDLLALPLDPASEIIVLTRMESAGLPTGDRLERARILQWGASLSLREGEVRWIKGSRGLWAVFLDGGALRAERMAPVPSAVVAARIQELARVGGLAFGLDDAAPGGGLTTDIAAGALRIGATVIDPARMRALTTSRRAIFAGLVILLFVVMAGGLIASLRAAQREMRLARLKSEFISGVSHELRTPLTSIRIFADLLSTPGPAEKREEHAALLKREAERLSGLVERVLDFARLEKGGGAYRLEERDLAAVVDEAVRTFRAPRPGFSVRMTRSTEPLTARVDALGVEQIIHNLLDNAAKYAADRPEAEVVLRRDGARAVLEVRDSGPGIEAADLPHVFETFYRGPSATRSPGTGLGLAIVRQIAEAHGGSVRVASVPAEGATFSVEIPLCRASSS